MKGKKTMATFFEIFNKVLLELNYRTVGSFEDIYKNEHTKILDAINRVNEEVLSSYEWPFLLRTRVFEAKQCDISTIFPSDKSKEVSHISTISGENQSTEGNTEGIPVVNTEKTGVNGIVKAVFKGLKRLKYFPSVEKAIMGSLPADCYTVFETSNGAKILVRGVNGELLTLEETEISPDNNAKEVSEFTKSALRGDYTVFYYSKACCIGANGEYKTKMTAGDDASIIPMPWAEHVLLYGTCLKVKANPAYPKFGFWNTMYIQALANLRKKSPSAAEDEPFLSLTG